MDNFNLKKFLVENKLTTNSKAQASKKKTRISEGFLDNIAKTLTGKSDKGAELEKQIQKLLPGFKNGGYVYFPQGKGGSDQKEWDAYNYIQAGGNLDVQFPMLIFAPGMGKGSMTSLSIVRQRVKFNYDLEVPTVQSLSMERFNIAKQKFMPVNEEDLIPEDPIEITPEEMAGIEEEWNHTAQIKMVPLLEVVENWPGPSGDAARRVLAKRQQQ